MIKLSVKKIRFLFYLIISLTIGLNLSILNSAKPHNKMTKTWRSKEKSYLILTNFVHGQVKFNYSDSVTYTTHGTPEYLYNLEELSKRWNGPISVAVYTPGSDLLMANDIINKLVYCGGDAVRKFVSFHLFFERNDYFNQSSQFLIARSKNNTNCSEWEKEISNFERLPESFRFQKDLTYPVNVGRNIARKFANTYFVLASDIELFPSEGFIEKFLSMVGREIKTHSQPKVYVLPVFEVSYGVDPPRNKSELVKLFRKGQVITFHKYRCLFCHRIPDEDKWLNLSTNEKEMNVFKVVKRRSRWEPIFIGTNKDPLYDERLDWEGMNDKMSQTYEMCLMNYEFHILDNAFLVHSPGITLTLFGYSNWRKPFSENGTKLYKQIIREINHKYSGKKNTCYY